MKAKFFAFGTLAGLTVGAIGVGFLLRELQHTRTRLADFELKEAKMKAHHERRKAFEDALIDERAERSSRRLRHDDES